MLTKAIYKYVNFKTWLKIFGPDEMFGIINSNLSDLTIGVAIGIGLYWKRLYLEKITLYGGSYWGSQSGKTLFGKRPPMNGNSLIFSGCFCFFCLEPCLSS